MPLTLAVSGLTTTEKTALVSAIKSKASQLTIAWTLYWESSEFPSEPDALLYCAKRDEGRRWSHKLKNSRSLFIEVLPPLESTPSEVPLFVRMPFNPQDIVEALNIAAKRVLAFELEESKTAPTSSKEERVDIQLVARGASRVPSLILTLYAIFQGSDPSRFYKIKQAMTDNPIEIWCWPDLQMYWSSVSEEQILDQLDAQFDVYNCQGKKEALTVKNGQSRSSVGLLWKAGLRAFKTSEILPWFSYDNKISLLRWPQLPIEARTIPVIRIFSKLTYTDATFAELLTELKLSRKDLSSIVNGLIMNGDITKAKDIRPAPSLHKKSEDPEQILFLKALSLRCSESLERSVQHL